LYEQYTKQFGKHRQLSGERLETARRVSIQDGLFGVSLGALVAVLSIGKFVSSSTLVLFGSLAAWAIIRLLRHETYFQLRLSELKASKTEAKDAFTDLNKLAEKLKK
jgi:uncharacterized membrane protein